MPGLGILGLGFPAGDSDAPATWSHHHQLSTTRRKRLIPEANGDQWIKQLDDRYSPDPLVSITKDNINTNTNTSKSSTTSGTAGTPSSSISSSNNSNSGLCDLLPGWASSFGGPDPDLERRAPFKLHTCSKVGDHVPVANVQAIAGSSEALLDPANNSFSLALIECQNRRVRSEGLKQRRKKRPVSLDSNSEMTDASISSPSSMVDSGGGKKRGSPGCTINIRSGMFSSPGTPIYRSGCIGSVNGYQKGWSSERVPLANNTLRRYGNATGLPFGNGRTVPSKWVDAEKWICSPISVDGINIKASAATAHPHRRQPKSKSGPLGPPGFGGPCPSASPLVPGSDVKRTQNFVGNSFLMTGVLLADSECRDRRAYGIGGYSPVMVGGENRSYSAQSGCILRSSSVHGWSELLPELHSPISFFHDEKLASMEDSAAVMSHVILRKDMGTQMSPESSISSSPKERELSFSVSPPQNTLGVLHNQFSKMDVRDVRIDDRVTITRWSKNHMAQGPDKSSSNFTPWKKKTTEPCSSWETAGNSKSFIKLKREEAKITAWENLQKAKAEAAIRKLEMKLEKKRSSSMDKILKKLKLAQRKAQEMRTVMNSNQVANATGRHTSSRRAGQAGSLSGCFSCHAF